uniref:Uncharacterized protein n=1 Tax=Anguilla anguilla TaxID=7936 RepID=A0A0E9WNL2_ANGAN
MMFSVLRIYNTRDGKCEHC